MIAGRLLLIERRSSAIAQPLSLAVDHRSLKRQFVNQRSLIIDRQFSIVNHQIIASSIMVPGKRTAESVPRTGNGDAEFVIYVTGYGDTGGKMDAGRREMGQLLPWCVQAWNYSRK
jgi:hypothetical protein